MLEIKNLTKRFYQSRSKTVTVVDGLSLSVKKGEVYGFLGPNGAGKTTTVKMIAGLLYPDSGSITLDKQPAGSTAGQKLIGFMPETPQFYRHLRVKEVLEFAGTLFGMDSVQIKSRANRLLEEVGLQE